MDRPDEKKDQRTGDVLGLGETVSPDVTRPHTSEDPEEVRKRRERMQEGADELAAPRGEAGRHSGATGVDMGAGGEGTDIE